MKVFKEGQEFEGSVRACAKWLGVNPSSLSRAGKRLKLSRKLAGVTIERNESDAQAGDKARTAAYTRRDLIAVPDPLFGTVYRKRPADNAVNADDEIVITPNASIEP